MAIDIESPGANETDLKAALRALLTFRGARVRKSAAQNAANYTSITTLTWATEDRDTDAFFDSGASTTLFTIPASGVSKVRVSAFVRAANVATANFMYLAIRKGGSSSFNGNAIGLASTLAGTWQVYTETDVIDVTGGDTFDVQLQLSGDTSIDIQTDSYFAIEVIQ